jgi:hypothetical protein
MKRKVWVLVKRGLSEDPKHRELMGECVWMFLHIIDHADWETGKVWSWRDEDCAEDMDMPVRTVRDQRRKLRNLGYITCKQRKNDQVITILKWVNPRSYSGETINNVNKGDVQPSPSKYKGDTKGDTKGGSQNVTPSIRDHGSWGNTPALALLSDELGITFTRSDRTTFENELPNATPEQAKSFIAAWRKDKRSGGYPPSVKQIINLWHAKPQRTKSTSGKLPPLYKAK